MREGFAYRNPLLSQPPGSCTVVAALGSPRTSALGTSPTQVGVKQQQCLRAALVTGVLGGHQKSKKECVGAQEVTSLLSSYPTPALQCQIFPLKWQDGVNTTKSS